MRCVCPALLLCVVCLLVSYVPVLPWADGLAHDAVRFVQLLCMPLIVGVAWARRGTGRAGVLVGALLVLGGGSVLGSEQPLVAVREWCLTLSLAIGACSLGRIRNWGSPRGAQALAGLLLGGVALYAGLELLLLVLGIVLERTLDYWRVFAGYVNPRFLNHVQTLLIPLLIGLLGLPEVRGWWRRLAWFSLVANAFFLLLLLGRATVLALIVSASITLLFFGPSGLAYARRLVIAFIAGAVLYLLLIKLLPWGLGMDELPVFRELGERGSVEARLYLWRIALDMVAAHPWLGVGPMHYAHQFNGEAAHPHNIYLQIAAEYGLPFLLVLSVVCVRWLWQVTRQLRLNERRKPDPLALACYVGVVGALVDGGFSGNFVMPLPQLWIVLTVALLQQRLHGMQVEAPVEEERVSSGKRSKVMSIGLLLLLAIQIYVITVSWREFWQPPARITGAIEPEEATHYSPRFWRDGWF